MTLLFTPVASRAAPAQPLQRLRLVGDALHQSLQRWRRRRDADDMRRALSQLDDRTLHDLGLHRSEIGSLTSELSGFARVERQHALLALSRPL